VPPSKNKNNDKSNGLTIEDPLTSNTDGLISKTDKLNGSIHLPNNANPVKSDWAKKPINDLAKSDNSLLMANEEPAKTCEKLVKLNKELAAAGKELERISEQFKHQNLRQREFIQNTSNELRSSTQSILGHVEILLSESQSMSEYVEPITRSAISFQQIISDILENSKIDNNV
jgi:signal transduction histidine kinase